MKYYGRTLDEWLDEPLCVVVYQFQYAKKWEIEETQKLELMIMGSKLTQEVT